MFATRCIMLCRHVRMCGAPRYRFLGCACATSFAGYLASLGPPKEANEQRWVMDGRLSGSPCPFSRQRPCNHAGMALVDGLASGLG